MNSVFSDKKFRITICISAAILIIAIATGLLLDSSIISTEIIEDLKSTIAPLKDVNPLVLFFIILANNALKSLLVILLGIFAGVPGLIFMYINGAIIGIVFSFASSSLGWQSALASTLPHGIIEIPLLIITVALSLLIGWETLRWLMRKQSTIKSRLSFGLRTYLKLILPGLVLAALIETFVTPLIAGLI